MRARLVAAAAVAVAGCGGSGGSGVLADPKASADAKSSVLRELIGRASPITDVRGGRGYRLGMLDVMSRRTLALALERR